MKAKIAILVLLSSTPWSAAQSTVPILMSYQGRVTDSSGTAIGSTSPVNRSVTFRLYSVSSGGTASYNETQTVTISGGEFSVLIGNGTGLSGLPGPTSPASPLKTLDNIVNTASTNALYLGITVDDGNSATVDTEISPRQQLVTGAFALRSRMAETVASGAVTSTMLGDGSVNTNQVATGAISSAKIADASISAVDIAGSAITAAKIDTTTIGLWTPSGNNIYRNSSVGIGTTNPDAVLQVAAKTGSSNPANNGIRVFNATSSADNNAVLAAAVAGAASGSPFTSYDIAGIQGWSIGVDNADGDKLVFKNSWDFAANPKMAIDVAGNVGIGTTSPTEKLMVSGGSVRVSSTSNPYLVVSNGINQGILGVATGAGSWSNASSPNDVVLKSDSSKLILQSGENAAGIIIDTSSNVSTAKLSANTLAATSSSTSHSQGAILQWNKSNGDGATWLLNQKGGGSGGIIFGEVTTTNTVSERMRIASNGFVGIGVTNPVVQLDVRGFTARSQNDFKNGTSDSGDYSNKDVDSNNGTPSGGLNVSIRAEGYVESLGAVYFSDRRIKNIVSRANSSSALEQIKQLQVTDYRMVDTTAHGDGIKTGLIAQELQTIMPEALSVRQDYIPNIYEHTSSVSHDITTKSLQVTTRKPHGLIAGDMVRIFDDLGQKETKINQINGPNTFTIDSETKPTDLFVYGKRVDDFLAVDYDRVFTSGISAIQELSKELDEKDAVIRALEARLSALEKRIPTAE